MWYSNFAHKFTTRSITSVFKAEHCTTNLSFALIFTFTVCAYTIWCSICSYPLNLHGKCTFDPRLDLKVKYHWFSLLRRTRLLKSVIWPSQVSQVGLSLPLQEWMAHWGCCKSQRWRSCVPTFPLNPSSPNIVGLGIDRVMPCLVMNCPLKTGWCWASSVPLPLEYPGKMIASWCIVRWKAARVFFV